MKNLSISVSLIILLAIISETKAGVTGFSIQQTPADPACAGCVSNDILIDFEGNLRGQQLYLKLDSGAVFNETTFATDTAPSGAIFPVDAAIEFDSFLTIGGLIRSRSESTLVVGGAVDIPGAPSDLQIGPKVISAAWAPGPGVDIPSGNNFPIARITLTPGASGNLWIFSSTSGGDPPFLESRLIFNNIPEPNSILLAGIASLCAFTIRFRR